MINFLVLAAISYGIGMLFQIYPLYNIAYFFLAVHIFLILYHYNIEKNLLIIHQISESHIFLHEEIECKIDIINKGRIPILFLEVEERIPLKLSTKREKRVIFLAAGEKKSWQIKLNGRKRGFYQIGPVEWKSADIIGYKLSKGEVDKKDLLVFPRILKLEELGLPSKLAFSDIKCSLPIYKDPYQVVGIREYVSGDRLNKIHWKATAKTGELQVRKNPSTVSLEAALILNLDQDDYGLKMLERNTDLAITTAASLAYYLNEIGQSFSFITNGYSPYDDYKEAIRHSLGSGETHLQEVLESLAMIQLSKGNDFLELLDSELELAWGAVLIIITKTDTDKLMLMAKNLVARGFIVKILVLKQNVKHKEYLNKAYTAPISIYRLSREEDIYGLSQI
ncbi:DUF58 domain-containing protein [Natronospora cellulosivora (SeqCode)]